MNHGNLRHLQLWSFLLALLIPGTIFLMQIKNILPLYTNSQTRNAVRTALTAVADREGWLLSNVSVREVTKDHIRLIYRDHHRGPDQETCSILMLTDNSLHPCVEKQS